MCFQQLLLALEALKEKKEKEAVDETNLKRLLILAREALEEMVDESELKRQLILAVEALRKKLEDKAMRKKLEDKLEKAEDYISAIDSKVRRMKQGMLEADELRNCVSQYASSY
jgi:hypothetical protein